MKSDLFHAPVFDEGDMFPGLRMLTGRPLDRACMHICSATHLLCPYPSDSSFHCSVMSADSINVFVSAMRMQNKNTLHTLLRFRKREKNAGFLDGVMMRPAVRVKTLSKSRGWEFRSDQESSKISPVGSSRVWRFANHAGRVGTDHPIPPRPVKHEPTRETALFFSVSRFQGRGERCHR